MEIKNIKIEDESLELIKNLKDSFKIHVGVISDSVILTIRTKGKEDQYVSQVILSQSSDSEEFSFNAFDKKTLNKLSHKRENAKLVANYLESIL